MLSTRTRGNHSLRAVSLTGVLKMKRDALPPPLPPQEFPLGIYLLRSNLENDFDRCSTLFLRHMLGTGGELEQYQEAQHMTPRSHPAD
jgi:hypothetical protein